MDICILIGLFAHFMADFTFQTNYIAAKKAESYFGVFLHCSIVLTVCLISMIPWGLRGVFLSLCISVFHFGIDCHKLFYTKKYNPSMLEHFYIDQILHVLTVLLFVTVFDLKSVVPEYLNPPFLIELFKIINALLIVFGANTIAIVLYMHKFSLDKQPVSFEGRVRLKNSICGLFFFLVLFFSSDISFISGLGAAKHVVAIAMLMPAFYLNFIFNREISKRDRGLKIIFHIIWAIIIFAIFLT